MRLLRNRRDSSSDVIDFFFFPPFESLKIRRGRYDQQNIKIKLLRRKKLIRRVFGESWVVDPDCNWCEAEACTFREKLCELNDRLEPISR